MVTKMFRIVLLIVLSYSNYINCVEVCDDFKYYVKPNDAHCHNNPDGERNMVRKIVAVVQNFNGGVCHSTNLLSVFVTEQIVEKYDLS